MKKQSILFTFAFAIVLSINLLSFYSCSTDDFEDEDVYTLASNTRKRVGEGGNNSNNTGYASLGDLNLCNKLSAEMEKNYSDWILDSDDLGQPIIRMFNISYCGRIYYYEDSITHNRTYACSLSWTPHDSNRFSLHLNSVSGTNIDFTTYIFGDNSYGEFPHGLNVNQ